MSGKEKIVKPGDADFATWAWYASSAIASVVIVLKNGKRFPVALPKSIAYDEALNEIQIQEAGYFPNHVTLETIKVSDIEQLIINPSA